MYWPLFSYKLIWYPLSGKKGISPQTMAPVTCQAFQYEWREIVRQTCRQRDRHLNAGIRPEDVAFPILELNLHSEKNEINKPLHPVPSQLYPNLQVQLYDPTVFLQMAAPLAHLLSFEAHSSTSRNNSKALVICQSHYLLHQIVNKIFHK